MLDECEKFDMSRLKQRNKQILHRKLSRTTTEKIVIQVPDDELNQTMIGGVQQQIGTELEKSNSNNSITSSGSSKHRRSLSLPSYAYENIPVVTGATASNDNEQEDNNVDLLDNLVSGFVNLNSPEQAAFLPEQTAFLK